MAKAIQEIRLISHTYAIDLTDSRSVGWEPSAVGMSSIRSALAVITGVVSVASPSKTSITVEVDPKQVNMGEVWRKVYATFRAM